MLFLPEHIEMMKTGEKTVSRRDWKKPHVKVGGTYPAQARMFQPKSECPLFTVKAFYQQRLGDMTEEDARKEGGYTLEEYKKLWERLNKESWNDDKVVSVVEWHYPLARDN